MCFDVRWGGCSSINLCFESLGLVEAVVVIFITKRHMRCIDRDQAGVRYRDSKNIAGQVSSVINCRKLVMEPFFHGKK